MHRPARELTRHLFFHGETPDALLMASLIISMTADCGLPTMDCRLWTADCGLENNRGIHLNGTAFSNNPIHICRISASRNNLLSGPETSRNLFSLLKSHICFKKPFKAS